MLFLTAERRLLALFQTHGFRQLKDSLNLLLDQPVWWYCSDPDEPIHILESHNKVGCGLLHDSASLRDQWHEATVAAIHQAIRERVALMAASPPEQTQVIVPVLCGGETLGTIGLAHLPNYEQRRLYPLLPLLTQHLQQIAERERASEDLLGVKRLWKEVISTLDLEILSQRILEEIVTLLDAREGVILLVDQEHRLVKSAATGFDPNPRLTEEFAIPSTPYENKVFAWPQAAQMLSEGDPLRGWFLSLFPSSVEGRGVWAVPLTLAERLLGLVLCTGREGATLLPHQDVALETLSLGASVALRNALDFQQLQQKAAALGTVHSVYRLVSSSRMLGDLLGRNAILNRMGKLILQVMSVKKCSVMLLDETGRLIPSVQIGLDSEEIGTRPLELGEGLPGRVAQEGASLLVNSPTTDPRFASDPPEFYPAASYLSVPMFEAEVIGVLTVGGRIGHNARFTEGDREVLHTMAEQAVMALLNIEFFERQERIALQTMKVFDNLFETGDPDLRGKAHQLARFMDSFAAFLKIDAQTRQLFQIAAFIHGASTARVPTLASGEKSEDSALDRNEIAVRMARRLELPDSVVAILKDLDECFDGSGGPRGLRGEEISMGARMLTLADSFFAEGDSGGGQPGEVLDRLRGQSGQRFDSNLFESLSEFLNTAEGADTGGSPS
ncbi:MAG: hypothetical protein GHCLOJNM_00335 [bacterium]|nr:hypothetical protein [bacterium]